MPFAIEPKRLSIPPLLDKPQLQVQTLRPLIERQNCDTNTVKCPKPKCPVQSPVNRLLAITLVLVVCGQTNPNRCRSMMGLVPMRGAFPANNQDSNWNVLISILLSAVDFNVRRILAFGTGFRGGEVECDTENGLGQALRNPLGMLLGLGSEHPWLREGGENWVSLDVFVDELYLWLATVEGAGEQALLLP